MSTVAEGIDAGDPAQRPLHEGGEIGAEQVGPGVGDAAQIAQLERGTRDNEGTAERTLAAG